MLPVGGPSRSTIWRVCPDIDAWALDTAIACGRRPAGPVRLGSPATPHHR
ncbi:hypothetical protein IW248_001297 [Micromonospora ureilytica]|uniref:Uncharacterized protein n=1 Tax=Micromonospora ureilytica TaxID=709868 RepID=A0ABS0JE64_9ACTN|nr:hypothetical protein [Micromonospora ureilytica]